MTDEAAEVKGTRKRMKRVDRHREFKAIIGRKKRFFATCSRGNRALRTFVFHVGASNVHYSTLRLWESLGWTREVERGYDEEANTGWILFERGEV